MGLLVGLHVQVAVKTLLALQFRFGDKPLEFLVVRPQNGTTVPKDQQSRCGDEPPRITAGCRFPDKQQCCAKGAKLGFRGRYKNGTPDELQI